MSYSLKYVEQIGAASAATEGAEQRTNDWGNLHGWMDLHQAPVIQPKSRRVSIIPPKVPLCWKDAIARRLRGKPHRTNVRPQPAQWECGTEGKDGPVQVWLSKKGGALPPSGSIKGSATLTPAQAKMFTAGDMYISALVAGGPSVCSAVQ